MLNVNVFLKKEKYIREILFYISNIYSDNNNCPTYWCEIEFSDKFNSPNNGLTKLKIFKNLKIYIFFVTISGQL